MKKVRVSATYRYVPCGLDRYDGEHLRGRVETNEIVKVVNKPGCPPANTMGHCYIEEIEGNGGRFIGLVANGSLHKKTCGVQVDEKGRVVGENYCTC